MKQSRRTKTRKTWSKTVRLSPKNSQITTSINTEQHTPIKNSDLFKSFKTIVSKINEESLGLSTGNRLNINNTKSANPSPCLKYKSESIDSLKA